MGTLAVERERIAPFGGAAVSPRQRAAREDAPVAGIPTEIPWKRPSREMMESVVGSLSDKTAGRTAAQWMEFLRGPAEVPRERPSRERMLSTVGRGRERWEGKTSVEWVDWLRSPVE